MLNPNEQFAALIQRTEQIVRSAFPIEGRKTVIKAANWRWDRLSAEILGDTARHRKAKLSDQSLMAHLVADITIEDLAGNVLDHKDKVVVFQLPHATSNASFIVDGKELYVINQLRLRPGLYTRFTSNDNVETFVNTSATGTYRVILDRQRGKMMLRVGASSHFPLGNVMEALGVHPSELRAAWGTTLFDASTDPDHSKVVFKLFARLRPHAPKPNSLEEAQSLVKDFFESKPLDPDVNRITIDAPHDRITAAALFDASKKVIALSKGTAEADDTESLAFKSLHSVEDFVPERLSKNLRTIRYNLAGRADRSPKVSAVINPEVFSDPVKSFFTTSEFSRFADQNNPLEMISHRTVTTTMGEGGISSSHAVTDQVRSVHPSHAGVLDGVATPEGQKVGITNHLSAGASKSGTNIRVKVINAHTGLRETVDVRDIDTKIVAFPGQYDLNAMPPRALSAKVKGRRQTKLAEFSPKDVDYIFESASSLFGVTSNIVPFLNNNDGNRLGMADRHIEQSVNLVNPDKPLVQAESDRGHGIEDELGQQINKLAPDDGVITKVTPDEIRIQIAGKRAAVRVPLYNRYPLNSFGFLHDTPRVKVGERVKKGDLLAENNFSRNGSLALGAQLRTAYVPYKGLNFEDGVVVSETAAKKLTSWHKYDLKLDRHKTIKTGLKDFLAHYPEQAPTLADRKNYDQEGIITAGTEVSHGAVLIPAIQEQQLHEDYDYSKLHRVLSSKWIDRSVYWDGEHKAKVVDVIKTQRAIRVILETHEPAVIGDKISHRGGGKGIIMRILPDGDMYKDEHGKPMDVLFNPTGLVGRVNPGQLLEAAAGRIAEKTGKTYIVKNFDPNTKSVLAKVKKDLKDAGIDENSESTLTDPQTGIEYPRTMTGNLQFLKLRHMVAKKFSARAAGSGHPYTIEQQPAKTHDESAQRIGGLETYALMSGHALNFLDDAFGLKGQRNDEYWRALQLGLPLPRPTAPFVSEKFNAYLIGSGINLHKSGEGEDLHVSPVTDKDILKMSNGEISHPTVVTADTLKPEKGGLFDPAVTGGIGGHRWAHHTLAEPIINPLMYKPVLSVLGLTGTAMAEVLYGKKGVKDGKIVEDAAGATTGGEAIKQLLKGVNVGEELKSTRNLISLTKSVAKRDALNKKRRYLEALDAMKLTPDEAYINHYIPIMPPKFRAIMPLPDGSLNVADPVHGYREAIVMSNTLRDLKKLGVSDDNLVAVRADFHNAINGLVGTGDPVTRGDTFKGLLKQLKGVVNKGGYFQGRVMSRTQDLSGRSTVISNPSLGIDEIGIPEKMGMTVFKPFLIKRLVELGHTPLEARELVETNAPLAKKVLELEANHRPVIMNRAPSLHKFNMMAFKPRIVDGKAIQVNPLIVGAYNMDFDGDTAGIHVPVSEKARRELLDKLLPSKNLFSPKDRSVMHLPSLEGMHGLYLMTKPEGKPVPAATEAEVVRKHLANRKGVPANTAFVVNGRVTTPGQILINEKLPEDLHTWEPLTKKKVALIVEKVAKKYPDKAAEVLNHLKDLGWHYVTEIGFSISLRDLESDHGKRDAVMAAAGRTKPADFVSVSGKVTDAIDRIVHSDHSNRLVQVSSISGAMGGKRNSVNRMIGAPVAVTDHEGKVIPTFIGKSYAEGHSAGDYFATLPGARRGVISKGLSTADTGYLTKLLVNANIDVVITELDCRTMRGILLPISDDDVADRVGARGQYRNQILTPDLVRQLREKSSTMQMLVRSPLTCEAHSGVCQKCAGVNENGQFWPVGYHLGVLAAQTIGEPSTQTALRVFHTGGAVGGGGTQGFPKIRQLLRLPENIRGKAVIARVAGRVARVEPSAVGGWDVTIGSTPHYVPRELGLAVQAGDTVRAGQQLSQGGDVKPQELLAATKDLGAVQKHIIDELRNSFADSGVFIRRQVFETALKPMTDKVRITDPGDAVDQGIHLNDVVARNRVESMNASLKHKIEFEPMIVGIAAVPHLNGDFVGRLMHERIINTVQSAVSHGLTANPGPKGHPVTQLAFKGITQFGVPK